MNSLFGKYSIGIVLLLFTTKGIAQNFNAQLGAWNGGFAQFSTYEEMTQGKLQTNQVTVQIGKYSGASPNQWKVTVRLVNDYINQTDNNFSIGAQFAQLQLNQANNYGSNQINPSNVPVALSTNEVDLIVGNSALSNGTNSQIQYNLFVAGGSHLLNSSNGNYRATYEFRLYGRNNSNQAFTLISTAVVGNGSGFQIDYSGNYGSQSIVLQNGANNYNFTFSSVSDYINGKSIEIPNGIKVTSYATHQVVMKASSSEFVSEDTSNTLPVNILQVEISMNNPQSNVEIFGPLAVSSSDQAIINRTATNPQELEYNLRFFIPPNAIPTPVDEGNYKAFVTFTIVPN
jgi:hypothetical protein